MPDKTYCPECHMHEVGTGDEATNCTTCGTKLIETPPERKCLNCGNFNKHYAKHCGYCGRLLPDSAG